MEDGQLDGIRILESVYPSLDNEALRVVSLMTAKWKPGRIDEKPVRVAFVLPVVFDLGGM
jgi:protein TonB